VALGSIRTGGEEELGTMIRRNAWWLFLALTAPVAALYIAGPGKLNNGPLFNAIGVAAVCALLVGIRLHRPTVKAPWYLLAFGAAFFVGGDVLAHNYTALFGSRLPFPSVADGLYLAVYPTVVAGLLILIRRRNPGRDWASLVDSLIVATGLALLSWTLLMAPNAHDASLALAPKVVSMAYPMMDTLLLMVTVRLAVGRGARGPAYAMMVGAVTALLVTDSVYSWLLVHGGYATGGILDLGWICFYLLWGAAALHPSMSKVSETTAGDPRVTRTRLLVLGLAASTAPVIQIVETTRGQLAQSIVVPAGAIVVFTLVVVRMILLLKEQEAAAARERTLREAGSALVTATSRREIIRAAEWAAASLAGSGSAARFHGMTQEQGRRALQQGGDGRLQVDSTIPLDLLGAPAVAKLDMRRSAIVIAPTGLVPGAFGRATFVAPVVCRGEVTGVLAVAPAGGSGALTVATTSVVESLALQMGLALESAQLTESLVRTEGEARFRALVQHSSDVIVVLTQSLSIEYVSPSVRAVLGYDDGDLTGRDLSELIDEDDRALALGAIAALANRSTSPSELLEFDVHHRDGTRLHAEALVSNLLETPAVGGIVMNLRDITERKEFEEQLSHQAFHDAVTGLANRALFRDRVAHALERQRATDRAIALLFLDLDDFKVVNDTLGHLAGDRVLEEVAGRIEAVLRAGDTAARLGGDEFAVLLEDVGQDHDPEVALVAERLIEAVRSPIALEGKEVAVQCSIGVAFSTDVAAGEEPVEELIRNADIAMYAAKTAGKGTYATFERAMREAVVEKVDLKSELRNALANGELSLVYQPIMEVADGRLVGLEALLRWDNPRFGSVSPTKFIPLAEETGLILPIGTWVLDQACRDAAALRRSLGPTPKWMTVNVSAWQLERPEIIEEVRDALEKSGFEAKRLALEITESMMIKDIDLAVERLTRLRELGVLIAVDDFGTGYSSLGHIRQLPINALKIDRSFVDRLHEDEDQRKVTSTIIELGRVLGLNTVAEGVEHEQQLSDLRELGCRYAQGFHIARPLPFAEVEALLRQDAARTRLAA
jgi:diguanylate cyclase (GGDEF)-like protein/PAS domain S-box-containing protein